MLQLETVGRKPGIRSVHQVHVDGGLDAVQGQGRIFLLLIRDGDDRGDDGNVRRRECRRRARLVPAHRHTTIPRLVVHDRHRRSLTAPTNCEPPSSRLSFISLRYKCSTGSRAASFRPGVWRTDRPTVSDSARFRLDPHTDVEPSSLQYCTHWGRLKHKREDWLNQEIKSIFRFFGNIVGNIAHAVIL